MAKRKRDRYDQFYSSRAWAAIRAIMLFCYRTCRNDPTHPGPFEVDHITPISEFWEGRLRLTNLQVLCIPCHIRKHHPGT